MRHVSPLRVQVSPSQLIVEPLSSVSVLKPSLPHITYVCVPPTPSGLLYKSLSTRCCVSS